MFDPTRHTGFPLEKRVPGSLLLQSLLAALLATYFYLQYCAFEASFNLVDLIWTMVLNMVLFPVVGIFLWNAAMEFSRVTTALRIGLAIGPWIILSIGIAPFFGPSTSENFLVAICAATFKGVITGMLVGSRVRPWGFLTFGTIEVSYEQSTYRVTSNSKLALLGTLPLRLVSISTFLVSALLWVYFSANEYSRTNIFVTLLIAFYAIASAYLSFNSPRRWILIVLASLLNLPFLMLRLNLYLFPEAVYQTTLVEQVAIGTLVVLWMLCIVTRTRVRVPLVLFRDHREVCLGQRYTEWETTLQVVNQA